MLQASPHRHTSTRDRRDALASRRDNPVQHIEARHAQIDKQVKGFVEDTLLGQGIDAYRYVEG